jgi:hypothetical protein
MIFHFSDAYWLVRSVEHDWALDDFNGKRFQKQEGADKRRKNHQAPEKPATMRTEGEPSKHFSYFSAMFEVFEVK